MCKSKLYRDPLCESCLCSDPFKFRNGKFLKLYVGSRVHDDPSVNFEVISTFFPPKVETYFHRSFFNRRCVENWITRDAWSLYHLNIFNLPVWWKTDLQKIDFRSSRSKSVSMKKKNPSTTSVHLTPKGMIFYIFMYLHLYLLKIFYKISARIWKRLGIQEGVNISESSIKTSIFMGK